MIVGFEWIVDAADCSAEALRDVEKLRSVFAAIISDLQLKTIGDDAWHKFPGEGGVTGLVMLTESHLACHTYPEYNSATFNLYCCRTRPEWNWAENLREMLGAKNVKIKKLARGSECSAGVSPAVAEASRLPSAFPKVNFGEVSIRGRGHLPHWEKEGGIYFVTFRLADSLPKEVLQKLDCERETAKKILEELNRELTQEEQRKIDKLFSEKIEEYLDQNFGSCLLKNPDLAKIVADSLLFFDGERYDLFAWCVMPNHVHVVLRPLSNFDLSGITHSWKSFTAKKINKTLNKSGEVWQRESYDHLIRNQEDFERIVQYVAGNPVKAGLKDWQWIEIKRASARRTLDSRQDAGVTII